MTTGDSRMDLPRTRLFPIGHQGLQAVVRHAPLGGTTPLGLLIAGPDSLDPGHDAVTIHPEHGLEQTVIRLEVDEFEWRPHPDDLEVEWDPAAGAPAVVAYWGGPGFRVRERFSCPDPAAARVDREVRIANQRPAPLRAVMRLGIAPDQFEQGITLPSGAVGRFWLVFQLSTSPQRAVLVTLALTEPAATDPAPPR